MTDTKTKAAGYIRVSSTAQIDNESLTTQRQKIKKYCKAHEYQLAEIYSDEGISGGSVKERHALLQALHDAQQGKFDVLIINDLSRFGRNARELLNNHEELEQHGIKLRSVKEGINFDTPIGKAMLTMLAAIAELELTMIKERMLENRIAKALRGIPTSGRLPFGRTFDEKDGWAIDSDSKRGIEWAADQFLEGKKSMQEISQALQNRFDLPLSYSHLLNVLKKHSGDTWEVNFEEHDKPITYDIPRLLDDTTIQRITDRLEHNRTNNRTDVNNKYLLTGFIRCMHCKKSLSGQIQHGKYKYYVHDSKKSNDCHEFTTVPLDKIEHAVFETIFENIYDVPSFEEAIKNSLPDEKLINDLNLKIKNDQKDLKEIKNKRKRLVDAVLNGTLAEDSMEESDPELKEIQVEIENEITEAQNQLDNLPDIEAVKKEANQIRKMLKREYQSEEYLQNMSFDDKKQLLHFLFDGKAPNGDQYGIYVDKQGRGKSAEIDYMMFGRLTGLRTIKGDDIDYFPDEDDGSDNNDPEDSGWTIIEPQEPRKQQDKFVEIDGIKRRKKSNFPTKKGSSAHKNSDYKTNSSSTLKK